MNTVVKSSLMVSFAAFTLACGTEESREEGVTWKGAEAHLSVKGHLNGEDLDIDLSGEEAASAGTVWCGRKYVGPPNANGEADTATAKLYKVNVYAQVHVAGEDRRFELEFKPHDFQSDTGPRTLKVIPRLDDEAVPDDSLWTDFEWHTPDGETDLLETSAQTGTLKVELYSGEPGEDGLMIPEGEGAFGATLDAKWSAQEHMQVSMTAVCTENELDLE